MKSDAELQLDVMEELRWEPQLTAEQIGIAVSNGVVSLSGTVDSYQKKRIAEKATWRVSGVKAVAEDIVVSFGKGDAKTDSEIAGALLQNLKWNSAIRDFNIRVKVEDGHVYLEGEVEWAFQRQAIQRAVENLVGVRTIHNGVNLKAKVNVGEVRNQIRDAFQRIAGIDANHIVISLEDSKIILHGTVRSYAEKRDAERAAWNAPGVTVVENQLIVELPAFVDK